VPVRPPAALRGLLYRRAVAGRDPVELAREVVDAGCLVALEGGDAALVERFGDAGLAAATELTVRIDALAALAVEVGLSVALTGPAAAVDRVDLPDARVVVPAGEPGAEDRCRALAGRRVRLVAARGRAAELAFVRCLNVLMAGEGHAGIAVSDPRLIAIAGERAAWNGRASDSWELVMPYGELVPERRRLVAAGSVVRVSVGGRP
jgi:proline dehydrogenase